MTQPELVSAEPQPSADGSNDRRSARDTQLPAVVRPLFFNLLDRKLDVDAAAALLQRWSDKLRRMPRTDEQVARDASIPEDGRRWEDVEHPGQELYRFLVYQVACALVGESTLEADPHVLVDVVRKQTEEVLKAGGKAEAA